MASALAIRFCMCLNITAYSLLCYKLSTCARAARFLLWGVTGFGSLDASPDLHGAPVARCARLPAPPADVRDLFRGSCAQRAVLALDHELVLARPGLAAVGRERELRALRRSRAVDVVHVRGDRIGDDDVVGG